MTAARQTDPALAMSDIDYDAPAGLFVSRQPGSRRNKPIVYRRFTTAADAIRFAVEEFPASMSDGVVMEVGDKRFDLEALRSFYRSGRLEELADT